MAVVFFVRNDLQEQINSYIHMLNAMNFQNELTNSKSDHLKLVLRSFVNAAEVWDEKAQLTIEYIGDSFYHSVHQGITTDESFDELLADCFRFVVERSLRTYGDLNRDLRSFQKFITYNYDKFADSARGQIEYALREMPISVIHHLIHSPKFKEYENFPALVDSAKEFSNKWDEKISERIEEVEKLKDALDKHEVAYNFVGLYAGFSKLGRMKSKEYKWAKRVMFALGAIIPIPLIAEGVFMLFSRMESLVTYSYLIKSIPIVSLTILLIYYFKISLSNYNSLRAQIMQIELRKSLCRFIQSYAEYAKNMKSNGNENLLAKFEEVVFSNIMTSEEKMPSTFDGLDQLAGFIGAIKGNREK